MNAIKAAYNNGECPDCGETIPDNVQEGEQCANCDHVFCGSHPDDGPNEDMDGDAESALGSAGMGTDEYYGGDCEHI